jgi:hypothetical protein
MTGGASVPSFRTGQKTPARPGAGRGKFVLGDGAGPTPNTNHIIGVEVEKLI